MADALAQVCKLLPSPLDLECETMVEVPVMMVMMVVIMVTVWMVGLTTDVIAKLSHPASIG